MKTYQVWTGTRNWQDIDTDGETVIFDGEELGSWEDVSEEYGVAYRIFQTEDEALIYEYRWVDNIDEERQGTLYEFGTLEEAVDAGFYQILKNARVL